MHILTRWDTKEQEEPKSFGLVGELHFPSPTRLPEQPQVIWVIPVSPITNESLFLFATSCPFISSHTKNKLSSVWFRDISCTVCRRSRHLCFPQRGLYILSAKPI